MKVKKIVQVVIGAFLFSNFVSAQEEKVTSLEPIVVYSRGLKENRLNTPFMIDVIDEKSIEKTNRKNVLDTLRILPSLNIHDGGNASTTSVWIRGVGSLTNTSMDDSSVDVVIDGISNGKAGFARSLLDVERVEVAKGPQGTLFGTKAEAGSVLVKTVDPHNEFESKIGVSIGNLNSRGIQGLLNVPLTEQLSFRIAAQADRSDDYIKVAETGKPLNTKKNHAVQAKLRWNDGGRNDAILSFYHDERKNFLPIILSDPFSYKTKTNGLPHNSYRKNTDLSLRFSHVFDFAKFESTTAYREHDANVNRPLRPLDMLPVFYDALKANGGAGALLAVPAIRRAVDEYYYQDNNNRQSIFEKTKQFSQEFKLSSEYDSGFAWVAGAYFEKRKRDFTYDARRGINVSLPISPTAAVPYPIGADNFNAVLDRQFNYETKALFGELTIPVTSSLKVIAGARYSNESLDYQANYTPNKGMPPQYRKYSEKQKIKDNFVSGRLGINYAVTPNWHLYAIHSIGNKFGGFADYGTNITYGKSDSPYKSAKVVSSEIGSKFLTEDGRFGLDISLFNNVVKNDHITVVLYPTYLTQTANADTRSRGVELGTFLQLNDQWQVRADATYLDTEVIKVPSQAQQVTAKGNRLPQAAKWSGSVGVSYQSSPFNVGFLGETTLLSNVSLRFVGSRYAQPDNVQKLGGYSLVDASIGLQSKHHDILVWSKNLTNRQYHAFGIMPGYAGLPAAGRTLGLNYSYKF